MVFGVDVVQSLVAGSRVSNCHVQWFWNVLDRFWSQDRNCVGLKPTVRGLTTSQFMQLTWFNPRCAVSIVSRVQILLM